MIVVQSDFVQVDYNNIAELREFGPHARCSQQHLRFNVLQDESQTLLRSIQRNRTECASSFQYGYCLLYTSPSPRDGLLSRMPSSA